MEETRKAAVLIALSMALGASSAVAAEKLRVGRAVPQAFSFVPVDVGMQHGIFKKHGLEIESTAFAGDAKMQRPWRPTASTLRSARAPRWRSSPRARR
jgi:ABC-type nitrate/sulfonate/bicarbonate transport system substrate-binding protein